MIWLLFWLLSLLLFLLLPSLCVEENRQRWIRRIRECRWNVDRSMVANNDPPAAGSNQGFHYVLSKMQEDEIRESFLLDKIKNYTMEVKEGDTEQCAKAEVGQAQESTGPAVERDIEHGVAPDSIVVSDEREMNEAETNKSDSTELVNETVNAASDENPTEMVQEEPREQEPKGINNSVGETEMMKNAETIDIEMAIPIPAETTEPTKPQPNKFPNIAETTTGETEPTTTTGFGDDMSVGSSDGEMMEVISFNGEDDGLITVPMAGECRHDVLPENVTGSFRKEPNGCAICLCRFEVAEKVTWSSNSLCQHVFHEKCIKDWLMASGRKHLKRHRREQQRTGNLSYDSDPMKKITGFPMLCPCCRQHFIMPEEEEESDDEKNAAPEPTSAQVVDATQVTMIASS